jgi:hypothetical protein
MKGLWDLASRKTMYNIDVVFREVNGTCESEEVQTEKDLKKVRFEPSNE